MVTPNQRNQHGKWNNNFITLFKTYLIRNSWVCKKKKTYWFENSLAATFFFLDYWNISTRRVNISPLACCHGHSQRVACYFLCSKNNWLSIAHISSQQTAQITFGHMFHWLKNLSFLPVPNQFKVCPWNEAKRNDQLVNSCGIVMYIPILNLHVWWKCSLEIQCQCDWYSFPIDIQRMHIIVMVNTQQPVAILGYGNVECTLETLKKAIGILIDCTFIGIPFVSYNQFGLPILQICKNVYSYFMALRNIAG